MARIFYSLALMIISPLIVFYLYVLRGKKNPGYRAHFKQRFGFVDKSLFANNNKPLLVHCASVGEVLAATPLIKAVQKAHPKLNILITCNTPTGREQIITQFQKHGSLLLLTYGLSICNRPIFKTSKATSPVYFRN